MRAHNQERKTSTPHLPKASHTLWEPQSIGWSPRGSQMFTEAAEQRTPGNSQGTLDFTGADSSLQSSDRIQVLAQVHFIANKSHTNRSD